MFGFIKTSFSLICTIFLSSSTFSVGTEDAASLSVVKRLLENIKNDKTNESFHDMLHDKVMKEHAASSHKPNQPFFYSDDIYVIQDIINLVLEDPEGIIDETASTGFLKVYRESDYPHEIEELFDREKRPTRKFQDAYLGQAATGPTNKVLVVLKVKGDEQNEKTLEKRLAYFRNNIHYIDAYPVKGAATNGSFETNPPSETPNSPENKKASGEEPPKEEK